MDGAGAGAKLAGDQVEVGRLARTVGADDGGQRAAVERAAHAVHRDMAAEPDGQVLRFQHRRLGHGIPALPLRPCGDRGSGRSLGG